MTGKAKSMELDARLVIDNNLTVIQDEDGQQTVEDLLVGVDLHFREEGAPAAGDADEAPVSIRVEHALKGVDYPYWYQFLEPTDIRPNGHLQIVAGPGVSISFGSKGPYPAIDLVRIQDASCLPDHDEVLNISEFFVPFTMPMEDIPDDASLDPRTLAIVRNTTLARLDLGGARSDDAKLIVQRTPSGYVFTKPGTRQTIVVQVPLSKNRPARQRRRLASAKTGGSVDDEPSSPPEDDGAARFAWEWVSSNLILVKTPNVRVYLVDENYEGPLSAFNDLPAPAPWCRVIEVGDLEKVPTVGALGAVAGKEVVPTRLGPTAERVLGFALDVGRIAIDVAFASIPVAGFAISLYEYDAEETVWGDKLSQTDKVIAGLGVALPLLGLGAKGVGALVKRYGAWAQEAEVLGAALQGGGRFPVQAVRSAAAAIQEGKSAATYYPEIFGGLRRIPPMPTTLESVLTRSGKAFRNPTLQEHFVAAQRWGGRALTPLHYLESAAPAARSTKARILLNAPKKKTPIPRVNTRKNPRPKTLDPAKEERSINRIMAEEALLKKVQKWLPEMDKAASLGKEVVAMKLQRLEEWVFNQLKGTIGEALAYLDQLERMHAISKDVRYKDKQLSLFRNVRLPIDEKTTVEFTDGVVGYMDGPKLIIVAINEVKSGQKQFLAGLSQLEMWRKKLKSGRLRFDETSRRVFLGPGSKAKTLVPIPVPLLPGSDLVFELAPDAERFFYVLRYATTFALPERYMKLAKSLRLVSLDVTDQEIRYLVRRVLEIMFLEPAKSRFL